MPLWNKSIKEVNDWALCHYSQLLQGQSQPVKGEPRPMPPPVKGEPRPLPTTTTPPPCPLMTTTTTPAPCPLMTTTTTTTTPKPLSPCEKWKLEQEQMRNNPYVMQADQPIMGKSSTY